ncbi:MAG: efflux RND transporter periplasmic adaptor subunit [Burkholderiales bacterium]|nr:efflux RND transporter periplasmic adaptor subunit [Burkholderiales bacterium]
MPSIAKILVPIVIAAAVAGGGYAFYASRQPSSPAAGAGGAAAGGVPGAKGQAAAPGPGGGGPGGGAAGKGGGPPPVAVEVTRVALQSLAVSITAVGSLRSDESVTLRPEVSGRVSEILFREGERVAKGATLVRIDASVPRAELEQVRANLSLAKSKLDRTRDLEKKGFVSQQARDEAESGYRVTEAAAALAEARLAKYEVRAPFAGIIGLRSVSLGDYVREGQDMVNLESIDPLKVDFRVPEVYLTQTKVGQTLQFSLDAMPGRTFDGRVFAINPMIDAGGRSIVVRAQVKNVGGALRPGMFARVRLLFDDKKEGLTVPETALVPQGADQFVFRVVDGRAQRSRVEIGQRRDGVVEVITGVAKDDVVVVAGQLKLREGSQVRLAGQGGPPGRDGAAKDGGGKGGAARDGSGKDGPAKDGGGKGAAGKGAGEDPAAKGAGGVARDAAPAGKGQGGPKGAPPAAADVTAPARAKGGA